LSSSFTHIKMSFRTEKKEDCCAIKSPKFGKLNLGIFTRNKQTEFALVGGSDQDIQDFAVKIAQKIPPPCKVGFAHILTENKEKNNVFATEYTQKNGLHHFVLGGQKGSYQYRDMMSQMDIILVNSNHFSVENQIDIKHDFDTILAEILRGLLPPKIKGLVLAGGRSTRMGSDKGTLDYHGKPQREYVADMLENMGIEAYISCRQEQVEAMNGYKTITDSFIDMGPAGAIMSAFLFDPNAAWVALACDLPLLTAGVVQNLLAQRNASALATAYRSPENENGFPEPLIALWEPKAFPVLLQFLSQGIMCPRKVLINSNTHLIDATTPEALMNVNTQEDKEKAVGLLQNN
jgi:molybdopterin-guanine dinucleotide biosynthesis protein A